MSAKDKISDPGAASSVKKGTGGRVLYAAVVVDIFTNPANLTDEQKSKIKSGSPGSSNPKVVDKMPRNTISAYIVSDGAVKSNPKPRILYPFFSPHLSMPIKPGEQVWVIFANGIESQGFWMTRISSDMTIDDLNYTHRDRSFQTPLMEPSKTGETTMSPDDAPTFPNGDETAPDKRTLPKADEYASVVETAIAKAEFTGEAVPRYSKQAPDMVLQGSNNTLIAMGEETTLNDDSVYVNDADPTEGVFNADPMKGMIDIVVGRDVTFADGAYAVNEDKLEVITNDRSYDEAWKRAALDAGSIVTEGMPDFAEDLSRVYLTMKSAEGDARFGSDGLTALTPLTIADEVDAPFAVVKSTHPRIISRADGSIKIVHLNGSNIVLDVDGNIQISCASGTNIIMGTPDADSSVGNSLAGATGTNAYVRGEEIVFMLETLTAAVATFASTMSSGGSTPGYGAPNPTLAAAAATLMATVSDTTGASMTAAGNWADCLSEIIKGE